MITTRRLVYGLCWLVLAIAAATVPLPFFALSPGTVVPIAPLVEVEGQEVTELDGDTALLAVIITRPSLLSLLDARLDERVDVEPVERFVPSGVEQDEYFDRQQSLFDDSFGISAAVALRAAGFDVQVVSLPQIVQVLPDSPADGVLQVGDLVRTINGVDVATAEELVDQARLLAAGDPVSLVLDRRGEVVEAELVAGRVGRMTRPGLGVSVDTTPQSVQLPFDVRLVDGVDIGGPSAGLMVALTIYDLVAEEDLLQGRRVTGTGSLGLDGGVGRIGSIQQKVYAAQDAGFQIFLAPASQAAEAQEAAGPGLLVIPVETFADALTALREAPDNV